MKQVTAPRGKVIVEFRPYRREGVIEIPDAHKPQSVEAKIVHDSAGEMRPGTNVIVSLMDGTYLNDEHTQCVVKRESVFMVFTEDENGKIATVETVGNFVIISDEGPIKEMGGFELPSQFWKMRNEGRVLATGRNEYPYDVGDVVYFEQSRAAKIRINGKDAFLVPTKCIHGMRVPEEVTA